MSLLLPGWGVLALLAACRRQDTPVEKPPPPPPSTTTAPPVQPPPPPPPTAVQPAPYAPLCSLPEGTCAWARCDMAVGRCKWPCGSDADCVTGARCAGPPGLAQCIGGMTPPP
jgi:hypothetical protein